MSETGDPDPDLDANLDATRDLGDTTRPFELEDLVARFVELRETDRDLEPREFVSSLTIDGDVAARLLVALRSAISVEGMFSDAENTAPQRIDDYEVIGEIGRGGMGVVFEVERGGERFALKTLAAAGMSGSAALSRFRREAESLRRLDHPGVVRVHSVGISEGTPFLVMDLLRGPTLADVTREMPVKRVAEVLAEVLDALQVLHDAGIHHRDLKPANVKLQEDGTPVLLDFGLVADAEDVTLTNTGDLLGTPRYMAPEQASGRRTDARTDVFGAGLLLYELLTGRPLYEGADRDRVLAAAAEGATPRARRLVPDLPASIDRILRVALARNPARRYQTAAEMAQDVRRFLRGSVPLATPPTPFVRAREWAGAHPIPAVSCVMFAAALVYLTGSYLSERARNLRIATAAAEADAGFDAWLRGRKDLALRLAQSSVDAHRTPDGEVLLALLVPDGVTFETAGPDLGRDLPGAITAFVADRFEEALPTLNAARRAHPLCDVLQVIAGRCALAMKRSTIAIESLERAAKRRPQAVSLVVDLADAYRLQGDVEKAKIEYERALRIGGPHARTLEGLARVELDTDLDSALARAQEALALSGGDNPAVENLIGVVFDRKQQHAAAQEIFRRLTSEYPEKVEYAFNLAFSLDTSLAVREAKAGYETVLALDPQHQRGTICMLWLLATAADESLADVDRAERLLVDLLKRDLGRSMPVVQITLSFVSRTKRHDAVLDTLDALERDKDTPDASKVTLRRLARTIRSSR